MDFIKNYDELKGHVFGEGDAVFVRESDCIRVTNRKEAYSSIAVHANEVLGDKQAYKSRYVVKLPEGCEPITLKLYHKIHLDYLDVEELNYLSCDEVKITDKEWTEISLSTTLPFGSKIFDFIVYFIQQKGKRVDILVKEFEVDEDEPQPIEERLRNYPPVSRQKKRLMGTIRWDAFSKSHPHGMLPCDCVARVLSYKEYHNQAPFFSCVDGEKISFPEYTLETWEKEADFAIKGGLDYFAYLWYESDSAMAEPRQYHLKSPNKDKILMCGILEAIRKPQTMADLFEAMKDSCYLRLDTRPVVFLYGVDRWSRESVARLCKMAEDAGIKEPLYIVGMSSVKMQTSMIANYSKGIDAISWYSVGATQKDMPYEKLKGDCEDLMIKAGKFCKNNNIDIIPAFTAGRDTRARIRTGVFWCAGDPNATEDKDKPYGNKYALPPTNEELAKHIETTIRYVEENRDVTRPYMICSYGWNEHEEGGWLCPTLSVDENNDVIRDKDGNIIPDTTRLDILRSEIDKF